MKEYKNLIYEKNKNKAYLFLNRPKSRNAISLSLLSELEELITEIEKDSSVYMLVIGAKGKAFCAGADLKERKTMDQDSVSRFLNRLGAVFTRIENLSMPVIAMINGAALGGGLELALLADFRIASSDAILALPETRLAIIPGAGGTQRLPRLIGMAKAKEMIFTGANMDAVKAREVGLVDFVSPVEYLQKTVEAYMNSFTEASPIAIAQAKKAMLLGRDCNMQDALKIERACYEKTLETEDRVEALLAFSEKRKPNFKGC